MASIQKHGNKWCVVYREKNEFGKRIQKWESFTSESEAKKYKTEVEYKLAHGEFIPLKCVTVAELMETFATLYGAEKWGPSMHQAQTGLINNYIIPYIGKRKLTEITPLFAAQYIESLKKAPSVTTKFNKPKSKYVTDSNRIRILKLCRTAFDFAVGKELINSNPFVKCSMPKSTPAKRKGLDINTLKTILNYCETNDEILYIAISIAFACSTRSGETVGLTWDHVHVDDDDIAANNARIDIVQQLDRISKDSLKDITGKKIYFTFPSIKPNAKTLLVLTEPKTASSVRTVWLPSELAQILRKWKGTQENYKNLLGDEYTDYNLVVSQMDGQPCEQNFIEKRFKKVVSALNLDNDTVFHCLRHASATYKMALSKRNIKSVQGDTGHTTTAMLLDTYNDIIDDDRKLTAERFNEDFYESKLVSDKDDAEDIATKLIENPALLASVLNALQNKNK